jgi:hypothetical protein
VLFDSEGTQKSPQSNSELEKWLLENHEIRRSNSEKFAKDVKKLSQMLIRVVGDKRVGKPVVGDMYFNGVLIAECILPSSDVAGVREVQSKLVVTIVTNLETLAGQLVNLNSDEVPPKALLRHYFDNLECYLPSDLDKQKFLKCMIGADDESLNYLVKEVVKGAVDWKIDFWKLWLSRLAFGDEFEKSDFWPDDPTRGIIAPKEITLDAVKECEQCEQRHVNWKYWQQILVKHDDKNGQFEGFEEYRLLLLLLMKEARKSAVTMDQLLKVYNVEVERILNPQEHLGAQWPYGLRELYEIESFSDRFRGIVQANT